MPLTDTAIAKRKWSPRPEILADRAGLRLACYSRGVKTWQIRALLKKFLNYQE